MTTTTESKPADLDTLQAARDKARAAAEKAAEKARTADEQHRAAEAARKARRDDIWHQQMLDRRAAYGETWGGNVSAARLAFLAAVREGRDTLAAWRDYRLARVLSEQERGTVETYFAERERVRIEQHNSRVSELMSRGHLLDTTPRSERGPAWAERRAEWNARVAEVLGEDRSPDAAVLPSVLAAAIIDMPAHIRRGRVADLDVRPTETYADALEDALRQIEAEESQAAIDAARDRFEAACEAEEVGR